MGGEPRTSGLRPGAPLRGELHVPGSKSIAQRALVLAVLAGGETRLLGLADGGDVRAARRFAEELRTRRAGVFRVGESGTLARFATAILALGAERREVAIEAEGTLRRRSSAPLVAALERAGVEFLSREWPLRFRPAPPPVAMEIRDPVSSQEVSGLLIALAAAGGRRTLALRGRLLSWPYLEMTLDILGDFGARVGMDGDDVFEVVGPLRPPAGALSVEPDASSAAVALAAACLTDGEVRIPGIGPTSRQGDVAIVDHLAALGCRARRDPDGLAAGGRPTRTGRFDLGHQPDLAPVLAAVALAVPGRTRLDGLRSLNLKESPRRDVLLGALEACGCETGLVGESLVVDRPLELAQTPVLLDPHGDHRMAFAFALMGLARDGVDVLDPGCVAKSWPSFWEDLESLGVTVVRGRSA